MASRPILLTVASAVTLFSIGAGSYLASRSSRLEASRAAAAAAPPPAGAAASSQIEAEATAPQPARQSGETPRASRIAPVRKPVEPVDRVPRDQEPSGRPAPPPADPPVTTVPSAATPPPGADVLTAPATTPVAALPVQNPPAPRYEEITIKEDSVIGIRLEQTVSTATARVEDRVTARVTRDVTVDGRTAIPAGARLEGVVSLVEPPGRFKTPARIGVRFTTLILGDNLRVPIKTAAMYRNGDSPAGPASAKIGAGAMGGAILGAVIGGRKGAIIGTTAGAAGGTAAVMASDREHAIFPGDAALTVRLSGDIRIQIERAPYDPSDR